MRLSLGAWWPEGRYSIHFKWCRYFSFTSCYFKKEKSLQNCTQHNCFAHVFLYVYGEDDLLKFKPSIRMGKKGDLSDFECGMVVGARRDGLSISKTAVLLVFSHTTISRVLQRMVQKKENIQWAAVVWTKMPCWWQRSEENGQTG